MFSVFMEQGAPLSERKCMRMTVLLIGGQYNAFRVHSHAEEFQRYNRSGLQCTVFSRGVASSWHMTKEALNVVTLRNADAALQ